MSDQNIYRTFAAGYVAAILPKLPLGPGHDVEAAIKGLLEDNFLEQIADAAEGDFFGDDEARAAIEVLSPLTDSKGYDAPSVLDLTEGEYASVELYARAHYFIRRYYEDLVPSLVQEHHDWLMAAL